MPEINKNKETVTERELKIFCLEVHIKRRNAIVIAPSFDNSAIESEGYDQSVNPL